MQGIKVTSISKGAIKNTMVAFPADWQEQKKIGAFFSMLDKALAIHQRKENLLRELKKGMLQKIFSQEIRFKDDNGQDFPDWNKYLLGGILQEKISNGVFSSPEKVGHGETLLINVVNLYSEPYIQKRELSTIDVSHVELQKNRVVKGDLFFTRSSLKPEGIGHCNIYRDETCNMVFDGHIMRVRVNPKIAVPLFVFYAMQVNFTRYQLMTFAKTTTMTTIGQRELASIKLKLPCIQEQQKISYYFTHLDSLISTEQEKVSSLQTMKKGFLQKMFV